MRFTATRKWPICMNPFIPKSTANEAGNWFVRKVVGLPSERIFRLWSHELFLVNQSGLLFSCNAAQLVARGMRKKNDIVAHRL